MEPSFFTVMVPTYNQAQYLGACLDSLLAQTDADWEAVVVNDGSTDETVALAEEYARRDRRVRIIHKQNGGVASALNEALRHARGEWICWLSSDDLFDPRKLESDRRAIGRHADCRFFFSYFKLLQEETQALSDHHLWGPLPAPEFQIPTLFYRNYINGITICVSRRAWQEAGFFDESLRYGQDYDMWLRLLARNPARLIPVWTTTSRHHALQGSATFQHACYYDTAKGALLFLNRHGFAELFPLLDLSQERDAVRALDYALDIAERTDGFLYSLGPNAALLRRVLEWLVDERGRDPSLGRMLRAMAQARFDRLARREQPARDLFYWKLAALLIRAPELCRAYEPVDPIEIGLAKYYRLRALGDPEAMSLANYLERLQGIRIPAEPARAGEVADVLLELPPGSTEGDDGEFMRRVKAICAFMARSGWQVLLVSHERSRLDRYDNVTAIGAGASLPPVWRELFHDRVRLVWGGTAEHSADDEFAFNLDTRLEDDELAAALVLFVRMRAAYRQLPRHRLPPGIETRPGAAERPRRQVVFIGRTLWGGGAERVMRQLATGLDRSRFEPIVVHLFDTEVSVAYAEDIPVVSIAALCRRGQAPAIRTDLALGPNVPMRWPSVLARFYERVPARARQRLRDVTVFRYAKSSLYRAVERLRRMRRMLARSARSAAPGLSQVPAPAVGTAYASELAIAQSRPSAEALLDVVALLRPDAILVPMMEQAVAAVYLAGIVHRRPYIASLHAIQSLYMGMLYEQPDRRRAEEWLMSEACRGAYATLFPSQDACRDFVDAYSLPSAHIRCLSNPVDLEEIDRQSRLPVETALSLPDGEPLFLFAGRYSPEKRPELLVEACAVLLASLPDFQCVLLGDGPMRAMLEQRVEALGLGGRVHLVGSVRNPFPYMKRARALVLTSWFESFGLVLVEAMACGTPTIAVDCTGGPRDILGDGEFGILTPPGDARALADAMLRVARDEALFKRLSAAGQRRSRDFGAKEIVRAWQRLLDETSSGAESIASRSPAAGAQGRDPFAATVGGNGSQTA